MSDSIPPATPRREFLAKAAAVAGAVVVGTSYASPLAAAPRVAPRPSAFDDSWAARVGAAKHRAVFDSPGVDDGIALEQALTYLTGFQEMFETRDADMGVVVVLRHAGTVMAMGDAMWDKYELGKFTKTKDPGTGVEARRNPFLSVAPGKEDSSISAGATLPALRARGVVFLACNKALMNFAGREAKKRGQDVEATRAEMRAGLAPGVLLQPSGIYATMRAQEVGCGFIKSS